jgi:Leucine-rich repeat (LRR) protein
MAQTLSLSHNRFHVLEHFEAMRSLEELNLNFNAVTSLDGLAAPRLAKLFLSNNRITSLQGLAK